MRLALVGDIHLFTLRIHPRRLLSRRVMAQSNLWLNRRHRFNHALMPALVERVASLSPELVLYSGDVTTSSLESEFEELLEVVAPLTERFPGVLVPGNHDRYTFKSRRTRRIETILHQVMPEAFPHVRGLKPGWKLLALDSAIPNRVWSRGALGPEQFGAATEAIRAVKPDEGLVVLCHYPCTLPPRVPSAWSHDLKEANALRRELVDCRGRVVFLHGHIHKPWHTLPDERAVAVAAGNGKGGTPGAGHASGGTSGGASGGRSGGGSAAEKINGAARFNAGTAFECINAGSPCMTSEKYPLGQGFWEITLPDDPRAPLDARHHVPTYDPGTPPGNSPGSETSAAGGRALAAATASVGSPGSTAPGGATLPPAPPIHGPVAWRVGPAL